MPSHRAEPVRGFARPRLMPLRKLRRAVSVMALAASLAALLTACGQQRSATGTHPSDSAGGDHSASASPSTVAPSTDGSPSGSPSSGGPSSVPGKPGAHGIESRVVYFSVGVRRPPGIHTVVNSQLELARFPSWFAGNDPQAAREIAARTRTTDFSRNVLVGWVETTGCSQATGATLLATGDRLTLGVNQPKPMPECLAPYRATAVFEVPRSRMPKHPMFGNGSEVATPAGPGRTVAFTRLDVVSAQDQRSKAAEVTRPAQLNAYLAGLPGAGAAAVRGELAALPPQSGERRFGYLLAGCRPTGAALLISPEGRLSASPAGDENIRCIRAEYYAAVLAIQGNLLPAHATAID
ncbi:hypothetical protein QMK19_06415 [Streptomyces sp. H10-C2]|uniref:hypothetical protein n=1 Tax=unclassified Streptomyces TaxID=2593676 RepID=UPI0024BA16C4|nr:MULTISPECIES: hypothetical protein [unclassified Streptomyces]MDJ0340044.1 hypothetical protein [Streptomyces sp. PH10-H1]MDJ0369319.1 hypothetical protein [Streptomyces sp. H10-C2]